MSDEARQEEAPPLGVYLRLCVMMFLQYAIWGAWLPILFSFLLGHRKFSLDQIGTIFSVGAVGAIIGPFIAGQAADRHVSTEKFLALSHLVGALLVWQLATTESYALFLVLSLVYGVVYAPTLALTNSLSFHHIPTRHFGWVRWSGTVGWIVVGLAVGHWLRIFHTPEGTAAAVQAAQDAGRADAFVVSAILGLAMGLYCFTLPHTPPTKGESRRNATFEALGEVQRQPLLTLFLLAVPISCIHQFYFVHTAEFLSGFGRDAANRINAILGVGGGGLMVIGQMTEIFVVAAIPFLAKSVSRKSLLAVGIAAYAVRMALFAYTDSLVPILLGVSLHGLCFGCFVFVAFMVVDEETTPDVRASAQNLFNLVIVGIGIIVGSLIATEVAKWATTEEGTRDYTRLFGVPMWASLACLACLLVFYPGGRRAPEPVAAGEPWR